MTAIALTKKQEKMIDEIPSLADFSTIFLYSTKSKYDGEYIMLLDRIIGLSELHLAKWLNITPHTFRNYKKNEDLQLMDNTKEHIIMILSLYKHGTEVFGNVSLFEEWLSKKNYFLDNTAPTDFLETISGIKFIDNRLTAMEYGDNV